MNEKPTILFDLDGVLADYDGAVKEGKNQKEVGFYIGLNPMPGAVDAFKKIAEVANVYIASTPSWSNPASWGEKRQWCEQHLGEPAYKKLILTHNKGLLKGDFLIDDHNWNGAENFEGKLILFGSEQFPNWDITLAYILEQINKFQHRPSTFTAETTLNSHTMENIETTDESEMQKLKDLIRVELDLCDPHNTPTICNMRSTAEGYSRLEKEIIERVVNGGDSISGAIVAIEQAYDPGLSMLN